LLRKTQNVDRSASATTTSCACFSKVDHDQG
jgi:hypothetical protein